MYTEWGRDMDYGAKEASCIPQVTLRDPRLTGQGVLIAVLDSGIDYFLTEFQNADGTTRILTLWDQSAIPDVEHNRLPPEGYTEGVLYTRDEINEALAAGSRQAGLAIVPQQDISGHGTAVAALAAGSQSGVAAQAQLVVVKLGNPLAESFPRTTQLMRGISYAVNLGVELNMPVVVNLSFGNTYGDHRGESLLERFIDNASEIGRTAIIIGSGNEGDSNGHTAGIALTQKNIELAVAAYETGLSIQIWKHPNDDFGLVVRSPGGEEVQLETRRIATIRSTLEQTQLLESPEKYQANMDWYRAEIAKCTYRQFTTGFYFGKPSEETQIYDNNTYVNEYIYLGIVDSVDERGFARFEQRNKFCVGDTIEIMKPDGSNVEAKVLGMYNEEGEAVESCPHSKQVLYVQLDVTPQQYDLMRVKAN